jgi:hypothetical protein
MRDGMTVLATFACWLLLNALRPQIRNFNSRPVARKSRIADGIKEYLTPLRLALGSAQRTTWRP